MKSLTVDKGTLEFDKNTTSYLIKLEHEVNEITINASAEDTKASVTGAGTKSLNDYINEFKIVVKAENESTKTYIVKVARKDTNGNYGKLSTDNSVKSISIANYDFKFNKDTKKYNILVDEDVNELEFTVTPNDNKSAVSIQNNTGLKVGLNKVMVNIVAENGEANEYLFNVYKIGEEKKEEIPVETKEEDTSNDSNIWMIIAGVELLIIIILLLMLLKKKKNNKSNMNFNNTSSTPKTIDLEEID